MSDIITERSSGILRVELNRPEKKNAMTAGMYTSLTDIFTDAREDEEIRVVLWHGAGEAFCAGNDVGDFLKNPPGPGESPQARNSDTEKPIALAVLTAAGPEEPGVFSRPSRLDPSSQGGAGDGKRGSRGFR